jgi:hypothetical protein
MSIQDEINSQLLRRDLLPLTPDQVNCLEDPERLEEAVGMLEDLQARCGVRLPLPQGVPLGGPFDSLGDARTSAQSRVSLHAAVVIDEMATDESRSSGIGNEFYITAFDGLDAALALASATPWSIRWVRGVEQSFEK